MGNSDLGGVGANIRAIEAGGGKGAALNSFVERVAELEAHAEAIRTRIGAVDARLAEREGNRLDAEVAQAWAAFTKVWAELREDEREELLSLLVEEVRMTDKREGTLRLILQRPLSQVPDLGGFGCGAASPFDLSANRPFVTRSRRRQARHEGTRHRRLVLTI